MSPWTIIAAAKRLKKKIGKGEGNIEAWVQSKITKAADYISSVYHAMDYDNATEQGADMTIATETSYKATLSKKLSEKTKIA